MFTYEFKFYENKQWVTSSGWLRPFTDGEALDESLDSGKFKLSFVKRSKKLLPFTPVDITVYQDGVKVDEIQRLVFNDNVTIRRYKPFPLYDHEIDTIELTKLLERNICDSMCVTNYLGHEYTAGEFLTAVPVVDIIDLYSLDEQQEPVGLLVPYLEEQMPKTIRIPILALRGKFVQPLESLWLHARIEVHSPSGNINYYPSETTVFHGGNDFSPSNYPEIYYTLTEAGTYSIITKYFYPSPYPVYINANATSTYTVNVITSIPSYSNWTITDVVNRLLSAGETRRYGVEEQQYVFDEEQAEKYSHVLAPELFFTRSTLFEALLTVGGVIHSIPRVVRIGGILTVRFDELGGDKQYSGTLPPEIYGDDMILGDEYCNALDSTVENMLNTTDRTQGAVTEPSEISFRAIQCAAGGTKIAADTMRILLDRPAEKITKLELKWNNIIYDVTPFLYESAEYETLNSYHGMTYPYSRGWALTYSLGGTEITGLNFVLENSTAGGLSEQYAVVNILRALGADISSSSNFQGLSSRVTYVPFVTARIIQKKAYVSHGVNNALIYNQGDNTVECEYYGDRQKGVIARIGNDVIRKTYEFKNYSDIPKIGEKIGNNYVALVEKEFDQNSIKATITQTPNFNKLAEYIGVNSNLRMFDISEKQTIDRHVNYSESVIISHTAYYTGNPMITALGVLQYRKLFDGSEGGSEVTGCMFTGFPGREFSEGQEPLASVGLAAASYASGNALCFSAEMVDNYGAGYQSVDAYSNQPELRAQRLVPYSDPLGNLSNATIRFGDFLQPNDGNDTYNYPAEQSIGNTYFWTGVSPWIINKDSRERLCLLYQLHHQADDFNIVFGSALLQKNALVTPEIRTKSIYFLPFFLNSLDKELDIAEFMPSAQTITTSFVSDTAFSVDPVLNDSGATAKSWALVDAESGEFYLGENFPNGLAPGATTNILYFNFIDNHELADIKMVN